MLQNLSFSVFEWRILDEVLGLWTSWKNSFCSQIQASSVSTGTPLSGGEPPCSPLQLTLSWTGLFCTEDRFCSIAKKRSLSLQEYCMKIQGVPAEEYSAGKKKKPPKKKVCQRKTQEWGDVNLTFSVPLQLCLKSGWFVGVSFFFDGRKE